MVINAVHELSMTRDLPHILVLLLFWFMFVISRAVTYFRINLAFLLYALYAKYANVLVEKRTPVEKSKV